MTSQMFRTRNYTLGEIRTATKEAGLEAALAYDVLLEEDYEVKNLALKRDFASRVLELVKSLPKSVERERAGRRVWNMSEQRKSPNHHFLSF